MPLYRAPVDEALFLLSDVFEIAQYADVPGFADATPDVIEAILREGARIAQDVLLPLHGSADQQGCVRHDDGSVTTPQGFRDAFRLYADGGWIGLFASPDHGGQGLPYTLTALFNEYILSANLAFGIYPGLTGGAIAALETHGSPEQKRLYLPPMIAGRWTGTMNLTEPQCGTDLGLIRTSARLQPDGSYLITGSKIFISSGEHDLADNIIHLVLARIDGAPAGTKGISLFVVPKFLVKDDGAAGARNSVSCGALEHKMGIHGNATCVMNFDGARGWLVGEMHRGLNAMFVMMNEARLGVGIQGLAQSEIAAQNACAYVRDRLQGRALSGAKYPDRPADPLIVHPDVRRTLLSIQSFNMAARALVTWIALASDLAHRSSDAAQRQKADDLLGLMTPVIKGVLTDIGFDNTVQAQQMFGGHGYIVEWGMEQFVRDARIAMLYEGANGIQALDLVGRKLPRDGGRAIMAFMAEVQSFLQSHQTDERMGFIVTPLTLSLSHLQQATMWFAANALRRPDHAGAGATDYMHLLGQVALGYMWGRIVAALLRTGAEQQTKMILCRFFMERALPETALRLHRITQGCDTIMALDDAAF